MDINERKSKSSISNSNFQICCSDGKAILKPVQPLPPIITELLKGNGSIRKEFKRNIRSNSSALSFTSMNAQLDKSYANSIHGCSYSSRIHGSVHHLISSSLKPENNDNYRPKFVQVYIFDSENESRNRLDVPGNPSISEGTMQFSQQVMHDVNPFIRIFKTINDMALEQPHGIKDIKMTFKDETTPGNRHYNEPSGFEQIGVLIVGGEHGCIDEEPKHRDIVARYRGPNSQP